ncbi:cyclic nucleotide-binding protein [Plantactinospora soyae]|uniref:Peptide zinc metalloprotease protein n=1 Tax=Plantactinospora soyae TaxID=1544732 RepID=A0A927R560_9ACTN|nr:cyclic nucleotide-binding protein [Plantactinospora soyae]MBE1487199.1 putative peptide zinc metalloprotease protein [Plantactinospora soyae]
MAVVESRVSVWEALAGRAPGRPLGPAEPGVWSAVVERLNPARARPVLRPDIEAAELVSVRGVPYVMLRSPDARGDACYLRLSPQEWQLAGLMDGSRTVARLVAEFARIAGRLAPDQVTRVVADLAGNRMLAELPVDAFRPLDRVHRRPWPVRLGRGLLAAAKGQRTVVADIDRLVDLVYRGGGRLLFTRVAAGVLGVVAVLGLLLFAWTWWAGDQSLFLTDGSYAAGAVVLVGLNVLALACHELGHALATKHAGRRVPAAGFLVYFGIPSVFVDTTDVWMAGRRARMLTTAAGPAAGLILAGLAQLVGLLVPETAPWTFKLAFAWYLNALFNLNPFLALDGYYLLMDWLEIPNLRSRGLAHVLARLRRRPPSWAQLDREGRLVALYGTLALLWVVIAVNLGWRIWTDRVAGLVLGLWRSGWPARLLLFAVIAGLAAPLVYLAVGWFAARFRSLRGRWIERRHRSDLPRRLDALRNSSLGRLPSTTLADLAARARWVRPRTGQHLVFAGAAQSTVYLVADGAMEGRRPGDPGGLVRQRLGPGGVIGLANALTGTPATLDWHTAGTVLLGMPAAVVVAGVGPLPGPPLADRAEAEALFAEAPALRGLTAEDRLGLVAGARVVALGAGDPVTLAGANDAVVVESGVIELPDGTQLRRGTVIGPAGEGEPGTVATARTPVRIWALPAVTGLPLLFGAPAEPVSATGASTPGSAPRTGVHPGAGYPPLAAPPGPPPSGVDDDVDRRFERRLWWLVLLFLLLALLASASNLIPGPAWAEMPRDRALLAAERGRLVATVDGRSVTLAEGSRIYVGDGDRIRVSARSRGLLTFQGGSTATLCAGARTTVGALWSDGTRTITPHGRLTLDAGRMLADTESPSPAFAPLALLVNRPAGGISNRGPARYTAWTRSIEVSAGEVRVAGIRQEASGRPSRCGADDSPEGTGPGGTPGAPESTGPGTTTPTPTPSVGPSPTASATPTPVPTTPGANPTTPAGTPRTTGPPVTPPRTTAPPTTTVPTTPSRDEAGPTFSGVFAEPTSISRPSCGPDGVATIGGSVADNVTPGSEIKMTASWSLGEGDGGSVQLKRSGESFQGDVVVPYRRENSQGGTIGVQIGAVDAAGNSSETSLTINLESCGTVG